MEIPKPSQQDRDYFSSPLPIDPLVEVKPMFGNLGAFVNGNMFTGLFGPDVGVRLNATDQAALLEEGAGPFGPESHRMAGYLYANSLLARTAGAGRSLGGQGIRRGGHPGSQGEERQSEKR